MTLDLRAPEAEPEPTSFKAAWDDSYERMPSLAKTLPAWYAPGYFSEANMRRRKAAYGVPTGASIDYNTAEGYQRDLLNRKIQTGALNPLVVTERLEALAQQNPLATPDLLLGLAMTNAPADPALMSADQAEYSRLLTQMNPVAVGSPANLAVPDVMLDRTTTGTIALPGGAEMEIAENDVIVRDARNGNIINVIPAANAVETEDQSAFAAGLTFLSKAFFYSLSMPYEGLVGMARNVGKSLQQGDVSGALLDVLSYGPTIAAVREIINGDDYINPWEQTYMGQMILANMRGESIDVGNGFFIAEGSDIFNRQLEAAAGAYSIDGNAFTFGRGIAGALDLDPNSLAYRNMSGLVDFTAAVVLDPTVWAAGLGIPSKTAKALTMTGAGSNVVTRGGATTVRAVRKGFGKEPGTGTLEFGAAKRQAAKVEARALRTSKELPKAREELRKATEALDEAKDRFGENIDATNRVVAARERLAKLEADAESMLAEQEVLRLIDDIEIATADKVDMQIAAEEARALSVARSPEPLMSQLSAQAREAQARIARLESIESLGSRLQGITGRAMPDVGDVVKGKRTEWTVGADSTSDQIVLISEKGARRKYTPQKFRETFGSTMEREVPVHTREALRTGLMNMQERLSPEALREEVDSLEALATLPGDVTVRAPGLPGGDVPDLVPGLLDSDGMVAAWAGEGLPQLLSATEQVPDSVMTRLWESLSEKVFADTARAQKALRDKARRSGIGGDYEDALIEQWVNAEALGDDLLDMLSPDSGAAPTWGDLLRMLNDKGLAPYLEEVIKKDGFDGIGGLLSSSPLDDTGVWWGYSDNLTSYKARIGEVAVDPDIRIRREPQANQSPIALVYAYDEDLAQEVGRLQGQIADYQQRRDEVVASIANRAEQSVETVRRAEERIRDLDGAIARAKEKWESAQSMMAPVPNYTTTARRERIAELQRLRRGNTAQQERARTLAERKVRGYDSAYRRLRRAAKEMSYAERIEEGLRISAGAGLDDLGRGAPDLDSSARFLFGGTTQGAIGKAGQMAIRVMARTTSPSQIDAMTRNKLPSEVIDEIVEITSTTVDEALERGLLRNPDDLARQANGEIPALAVRQLEGEQAEAALLRWKEEKVVEALASNVGVAIRRPLTSRAIPALATGQAAETERMGPTKYTVKEGRHPYLRRMQQIVPSAVRVDLHDKQSVSRGLQKYLDMAGVDRARQWEILDRAWKRPEGDPTKGDVMDTRAVLSRNVLTKAFDEINDVLVERLDDLGLSDEVKVDLKDAMRKATRVYVSGERDAALYWRNALGEIDAPIKIKLTDGTTMPMTGAQLESELAHGALFLPDPTEFQKVVRRAAGTLAGRTVRAKDTSKVATGSVDIVNRLFSDYWRSFMLLRPAYVVRNIMEMQVRNFLSGSLSIASNPLAVFAMAIGPTVKPGTRMAAFVDSMAPYTHDVHGYRFGYNALDDTDDQARVIEKYHADYFEMLRTDRALTDLRLYSGQSHVRKGLPVRVGQESKRFNEGWAEELLLLRGSNLARIVAGGVDAQTAADIARNPALREDILTSYVFTSDHAASTRAMFAEAGPEYQALLADRAHMKDYLFGIGPDGQRSNIDSVQDRLDELTGGNEQLLDFVRTGRLVAPNGKTPTYKGKPYGALPANREQARDALQSILGTSFKDKVELGDYMRVWVPEKVDRRTGWIDQGLDWFFKVSTKFERVGVMGPEWRYTYWETVREIAEDMTLDARDKMLANMKETGLTIRDSGRPLPGVRNIKNNKGHAYKRMVEGYEVIKKAQGGGTLTLDDAHRVASDAANEAVRDLYYDAHKRTQFWHALRLVIPFGQAWYDTWATWSRLAAKNPVQFYKGQKAFNAGLESGSNVIYETQATVGDVGWFEAPEGDPEAAPWYDPRQGFLFKDQYGSYTFNVPGLGHAMGALTNLFASASPGSVPTGALQSGFRVEGLNLLLGGGTAMPGIGPAISYPMSQVLERSDTGMGGLLYDWLFPIGEPDLGRSIFDQMIPSAVRRLFSGLLDPNSPYVMSSMGAATHYLLSTGNYGDINDLGNMTDPNVRERLLRDSISLAEQMSAVTALGQFILPTTPTRTWIGEDVDGKRVGLAAAASLFWDGYRPMYDDFQQAQVAYLQDFGPAYLTNLVGTTGGERVVSRDAFEVIKQHPDLALARSEELSFLFPGGGIDFAAFAWQQETLKRERLSAREWSDKFWAYTASVLRTNKEMQAIKEGWPDGLLEAEVELLNDQIQAGGGVPQEFNRGASIIESTKQMLNQAPDTVTGTDQAQAFLTMYEWRRSIKAKATSIGLDDESLSAKSMQPHVGTYIQLLNLLQQQNPSLTPIISTFRREVMG
jgi:hypothetical protein